MSHGITGASEDAIHEQHSHPSRSCDAHEKHRNAGAGSVFPSRSTHDSQAHDGGTSAGPSIRLHQERDSVRCETWSHESGSIARTDKNARSCRMGNDDRGTAETIALPKRRGGFSTKCMPVDDQTTVSPKAPIPICGLLTAGLLGWTFNAV